MFYLCRAENDLLIFSIYKKQGLNLFHFVFKPSAMKSNSKQYVPQGGYGKNRRMQSGAENLYEPIINWAALWSRLWLFVKRLFAEIWFLISRRRDTDQNQAFNNSSKSSHPALPFLRKISLPLFKITVALGLFFYVMQRDIQFSIEMKAPLAQAVSMETNTAKVEQMGFVQSVSFDGSTNKASDHSGKMNVSNVEKYIERFAPIARAEMEKYNIPASVKMAQAILESSAGQSVSAKMDNNHFGQPMAGQPFESAWLNWREHSLMINSQFANLAKHGLDYRSWARGLEKGGYSHNSNYANELLEIIDRFHLEQLDESTI